MNEWCNWLPSLRAEKDGRRMKKTKAELPDIQRGSRQATYSEGADSI